MKADQCQFKKNYDPTSLSVKQTKGTLGPFTGHFLKTNTFTSILVVAMIQQN